MDVTLATRRLVLRQPRLADAERLTRFLDNFAVAGNLARVPYPYRLSDARAWLRSWRPDRPAEDTGFTIELPGEGLVGHVGFHTDSNGTQLGYWLAQPFWNRGLMSEAVEAALYWFFDTSRLDVLRSGVFHFNKASLAIQRKFGFRETGVGLLLCLARGEEVRHIETELSRATWAERRAA
ncbi:MAG TPA: GNAT family N-acetyltransferase [Alphaproteobacteria bacterium]|nr:GNAT family N-acetyltransferase [Alphaproteobacteria bacterium]